MKVKEIGMKNVYCAEPEMNLSDIAGMMKRHLIGVVPVCQGKKLIGIITDRDLVITCIADELDPRECHAGEFMTRTPCSVSPETDIEEAADLMGKEQVRRLPVVENGNLVGMITIGDIATAMRNDDLIAGTLRNISYPAHAMA